MAKDLEQAITEAFNDSFVAYYKAHAAHWNIKGKDFYSDHKMLGKIYEDIFDSVDTIAEMIRTLDIPVPSTLTEIITNSNIPDISLGDYALDSLQNDLEVLVTTFRHLEEASKDLEYNHIANYSQDRVRMLEKWRWMLRSTLE